MQNRTTQSHAGVDSIFEAIARWVKNYREASGTSRDLAQCGPEEVALIAQDLLIRPDELMKIAHKSPDSARQLYRMLTALGVDAEDLSKRDPVVMRDLERLCVSCTHKRECAHDLDASAAAGRYKNYCPNAYTLDMLLAERTRTSPPPAARD